MTIGINDHRERFRQIERLAEKLRDLAIAHDGLFEPGERTESVGTVIPDRTLRQVRPLSSVPPLNKRLPDCKNLKGSTATNKRGFKLS